MPRATGALPVPLEAHGAGTLEPGSGTVSGSVTSVDVDRSRGLRYGLLGGGVGVAVWVGSSYAFDLVFHLQPALVGLLSGWAARRGLGRRAGGWEAAAVAAATAVLAAVGAWLIAAGDRGLDPPGVVAVVAAVGLLWGLRVLTRR